MTPSSTSSGFGTRAIHAGQEPDPASGAVIPPISLSTTFKQSAAGVHSVSRSPLFRNYIPPNSLSPYRDMNTQDLETRPATTLKQQ
jgi:cystathionine beta-lyase/cystathionine gamma-synthase